MSKAVTLLLRHVAQDLVLAVRPDGCVLVAAVMRCDELAKFTTKELDAMVRSRNKQRFTVAEVEGAMRIRAHQGHSMNGVRNELLLERLEPDSPELHR